MKIRHRNRQERWPGTLPEAAMKAVLILGPVLWILLSVFGICILTVMPMAALLLELMSAVCFGNWLMAFQTALARFDFTREGVFVKYPLEKTRNYSWSYFQQVCICYYSRATEMNGYPIICLVRKGERPDHFGRWKTGSVFHYRNILCLDYSEEQLAEIKQFCPFEIPDLRDKGNYRL